MRFVRNCAETMTGAGATTGVRIVVTAAMTVEMIGAIAETTDSLELTAHWPSGRNDLSGRSVARGPIVQRDRSVQSDWNDPSARSDPNVQNGRIVRSDRIGRSDRLAGDFV